MKEISRQFFSIWVKMKPIQKGTTLGILLFVALGLGYLVSQASSPPFVSLFPTKQLSSNDLVEIRQYLEKQGVSIEEKKEGGLLVPEGEAHRLRLELGALGIPRNDQSKGFELFDSNTWIKGEKELQVLEMRALKGQLEKDIMEYDNIKNANVILDMSPARTFGGVQYKTKASVILSLIPGARMTSSQLKAISYHLAGAVRGLDPHMIAISDTSGRLYQAIDPDGKQDLTGNIQAAFEDAIQEKMSGLLAKIAGDDHFYITLQAVMNPETEKLESVSAIILLERSLASEQALKEEIEKQLNALLNGYDIKKELSIHFVPLIKSDPSLSEKKEKPRYVGMILTVVIVIVALFATIPLFKGTKNVKKQIRAKNEEDLFRFATRVNVDQLTRSIEGEDPDAIAFLLSHLESAKAEKILLALPENVQAKVLISLSEIQREER